MRPLLAFPLLLVAACTTRRPGAPVQPMPAPASPVNSYVGREYSVGGMPGVRHIEGSLLDYSEGKFTFAIARVADATGEMLWLERAVDTTAKSVRWQVADAVRIAALKHDEELATGEDCRVSGYHAESVVAVVAFDTARYAPARSAWILDLGSERFIPALPSHVVCENPTYGEDIND